MPLPTSASISLLDGSPRYVITDSVAGSSEPRETPSSEPMLLRAPSALRRARRNSSPASAASSSARAARCVGVMSLPGVSAIRRAKFTASPSMRAARRAGLERVCGRTSRRTIVDLGRDDRLVGFGAVGRRVERRRRSRLRRSPTRRAAHVVPALRRAARRRGVRRCACPSLRTAVPANWASALRRELRRGRRGRSARRACRVRPSAWTSASSLGLPAISPEASTSASAPPSAASISCATPSRRLSAKTGTTSAPVAYDAGASDVMRTCMSILSMAGTDECVSVSGYAQANDRRLRPRRRQHRRRK